MKALEKKFIITASGLFCDVSFLVVPRKSDINGNVKYRVCVNFRQLNKIAIGDTFLLPNITDILDEFGKY